MNFLLKSLQGRENPPPLHVKLGFVVVLVDVLFAWSIVTQVTTIHHQMHISFHYHLMYVHSQAEVSVLEESAHRSLVEYVVVPSLPRAASVEWQVYARAQNTQIRGKM